LSFWTGCILRNHVVMAADTRRVYPERGIEDGRSNLMKISGKTWVAATGYFPLAGVILEGFRQVFGERPVDLTLLIQTSPEFRDSLIEAYEKISAEGREKFLPSADLLVGGISMEGSPYLLLISSTDGFQPHLIKDYLAMSCVNFAEPLQTRIQERLRGLKERLAAERFEDRRVKTARATLGQLIPEIAQESDWVGKEAEVVVIGPEGAKVTQVKGAK